MNRQSKHFARVMLLLELRQIIRSLTKLSYYSGLLPENSDSKRFLLESKIQNMYNYLSKLLKLIENEKL